MDFRVIVIGNRQLLLDRVDHEAGWEVLLSTYKTDDDRYMESQIFATIWEAKRFIAHFSQTDAEAFVIRALTAPRKNFYRFFPQVY